jgi:prophage regulatory protein
MADLPAAILRLPAVLAATGVSRVSIWRWAKAGTFPRPVRLGARAVGWRASDVQQWLEERPTA